MSRMVRECGHQMHAFSALYFGHKMALVLSIICGIFARRPRVTLLGVFLPPMAVPRIAQSLCFVV